VDVDLVPYLQKMLFLSSSCFDHSFLDLQWRLFESEQGYNEYASEG